MKICFAISLLLLAVGCDSGALETGYYPNKLNDSSSERQSYYASPYSPEATSNTNSSPDPSLRKPGRF